MLNYPESEPFCISLILHFRVPQDLLLAGRQPSEPPRVRH